MASLIHKELSQKVLGAVFSVHNILGPGLLESAYEGAMVIELQHLGIHPRTAEGLPGLLQG